ncbi:diaminohydroxyphosphoribosylaminopyrimidine deaminase [Halanaerobium saccharolyticum]|uniref:Riboflavin biosynthesis protein RibD n=1 Tax=Halanaerobium saccharolyticum TaxID=43595 RepID=A0A4R7Z664_9FIRM|nr:bifunctional diaminohydroxyphosphoribosylaminopyrimidine deaminase/5-amino-6-(5-phosphoribosylamino)uracil reductase RibD [Halanaerobium saccharolyticum]RAK09339.1 diaminohydroxyphosphoribosylaminopyrimidine deaminase [Halanaerobium saccharolyticum]TDW06198.1 diaminohydroxyphosphoribosylaminopyrimidine deaminase [Halanaerobium saccharolyticum]TDX60992.1 diaminohydroxyphosphoribosylaminopyrimidine deaminase [Halanaerobium saccharolyticum]
MENFTMADQKFMARALYLAQQGEGRTSPNPMVGAVVVKDGEIIGEGYHQQYGGPHAEVFALEEAGKEGPGADIYITLEPCSHYGKTPPCAQKLIDSGIKRAVVAMVDPNPEVAGRGIEMLREAGIKVEIGLFKEEAQALNEIFLKYIESDYPFIYLKKAQTLDGYIASKSGDSKWITNTAARLEGHKLRHRVDAIMVGIGTVLADDPSLTARLEEKEGIDPLRIILDPLLEIPLDAKIINQDSKANTLIITSIDFPPAAAAASLKKKEKLLKKEKVEIMSCDSGSDNYFEINKILKKLHNKNISSILIEGGAKLSHTFLKEDLIDKFYYFIAPKIYGGSDGIASFCGSGPELMSDSVDLRIIEQKNLGDNILLIAEPERN